MNGFPERVASLFIEKTAQNISRLSHLFQEGDQGAVIPLLSVLRRGDMRVKAGMAILSNIPLVTSVMPSLTQDRNLYNFVRLSLSAVAERFLNRNSPPNISFEPHPNHSGLVATERETGDLLPFFVRFYTIDWVRGNYPIIQTGEGTTGNEKTDAQYRIRDIEDLMSASKKIAKSVKAQNVFTSTYFVQLKRLFKGSDPYSKPIIVAQNSGRSLRNLLQKSVSTLPLRDMKWINYSAGHWKENNGIFSVYVDKHSVGVDTPGVQVKLSLEDLAEINSFLKGKGHWDLWG